MSLRIGDRLVIKRDGKILTPDAGEAYHEFWVVELESRSEKQADGSFVVLYNVTMEVVR